MSTIRSKWDLSTEPVPGLGVDTTMMNRHLTTVFLIGLCTCVLTGCPRLPYVEAYNNTPTALTIGSDLEKGITLKSGQTARFIFGGNYFKVRSGRGALNYPRNIPHSGEGGPYFDGTLRIQINPDGVIHALKTGEVPPLSDFPEQPYGYPLEGFEEGSILFALCLDEVQKRQAEHYRLISNRQRPTFVPSDIDFSLCLDRLRAKKETESRRQPGNK